MDSGKGMVSFRILGSGYGGREQGKDNNREGP